MRDQLKAICKLQVSTLSLSDQFQSETQICRAGFSSAENLQAFAACSVFFASPPTARDTPSELAAQHTVKFTVHSVNTNFHSSQFTLWTLIFKTPCNVSRTLCMLCSLSWSKASHFVSPHLNPMHRGAVISFKLHWSAMITLHWRQNTNMQSLYQDLWVHRIQRNIARTLKGKLDCKIVFRFSLQEFFSGLELLENIIQAQQDTVDNIVEKPFKGVRFPNPLATDIHVSWWTWKLTN